MVGAIPSKFVKVLTKKVVMLNIVMLILVILSIATASRLQALIGRWVSLLGQPSGLYLEAVSGYRWSLRLGFTDHTILRTTTKIIYLPSMWQVC